MSTKDYDTVQRVLAALANRPHDSRRGIPIPFVNEHQRDGVTVVDFIGINEARAAQCAEQHRCGLCGTQLDYWIAFLGGPSAVRQRVYGDPPMHEHCALAALRLCPHIAIRRHQRAPHHRIADDTATPMGFVEAKPDSWVIGITRSFRHRVRHHSLLFFPAPFKRIHVFGYGTNDVLTEQPAPSTLNTR